MACATLVSHTPINLKKYEFHTQKKKLGDKWQPLKIYFRVEK